MRGLPAWTILILVALTALLLVTGWDERHEAGWVPFVMGVIFAVFTLGAIAGRLRGVFEA